MKSSIPSLTLNGFITNKDMQMGRLFTYFLASDYLQSNLFHGDIASLKWILAQDNDSYTTKALIMDNLTKLYRAYFDSVEVNVDLKMEEEPGFDNYYVDINCTDDGTVYNLNKLIKIDGMTIVDYEENLDELYRYYGIKGE